jgi:hypothetical protein
MNSPRMNELSRISPVTDEQAACLVSPATLADLAAQVTAMPPAPRPGPDPAPAAPAAPRGPRGSRGSRSPRRARRWLIGAPLAAGLAVAALVIGWLGHPGQRLGPVPVGPPAAQALSFTTSGGYITVIVRDPLADAARYNAEFARHRLDIRLRLVPASPSIVGTVVEFSVTQGASPITPITATGRCYTGGGGSACPVGLRVPEHFRGQAVLVFGRAARPGEQYESTASAFAPGEVMHGMTVTGQTVASVLAQLRARHVTVPVFNYDDHGDGRLLRPGQVPGRWFVYDAAPWAPQQVMLFVGPAPAPPPAAPPQPGTPVPSPTAASS